MTRLLAVVVLVGCVQPSVVECTDGRICPAATLCDNVNHQCVIQDQFDVCADMADLVDCTFGDNEVAGVCRSEVCVEARCGDGERRGAERCDGADLDGKSTCADLGYYNDVAISCAADCTFEVSACGDYCGDGVLNGAEYCEPGMAVSGSCLDFGHDRGLLGCTGACQPDFADCESFGFAPVGVGVNANFNAVWGSGPDDIFVAGNQQLVHWDGDQWSVQDPGDAFAAFDDVWGSGPGDVWAVGANGIASHYRNGTWTASTIATEDLVAIWGSSASNVYAGGTQGALYYYDGSSWTDMTAASNTSDDIVALWGTGANNLYAAAGLDIMNNIGSGWQSVFNPDEYFRSIHGSSATDVWAVTSVQPIGARVFHKTTGGFSEVGLFPWSTGAEVVRTVSPGRALVGMRNGVGIVDGGQLLRMQTDNIAGMWVNTPTDVWGVNFAGGVRRFRGTAWLDDYDPGISVERVTGTSDTNIYVSGPTALLEWNGELWLQHPTPPVASRSIWAAATDDVWAGTQSGAVYRFNGSNWTGPMTTNTSNNLLGIWGRSTSDVWAVGSNGTIVRYNGSAWSQPMTTGTSAVLLAVWASSATDAYAVGGEMQGAIPAAVVLHYDGTGWSRVTLPAGSHLFAFDVWGTGANNVFISGFGEILHFDGTTWTSTPVGGTRPLYGISGSGPTDIYAVGDSGQMFHYNGTRWSPMRTGTDLELDKVFVSAHRVVVPYGEGTLMLMKP